MKPSSSDKSLKALVEAEIDHWETRAWQHETRTSLHHLGREGAAQEGQGSETQAASKNTTARWPTR